MWKRDEKRPFGQTFPELFKAFDAQNLDATFSWPSSESDTAMAQNWNANRPRKWFILGIEARNFIKFWGFPKCSDPRALVNPLSTCSQYKKNGYTVHPFSAALLVLILLTTLPLLAAP